MRAKTGGCSWCGHVGHPMTSPPRPRCRDVRACEARRLGNAGMKALPAGPARVCVTRHGAPYYFQKCNGILPGTLPHLELVAEKKDGTKFPPKEAAEIAETWGGKIDEVA